MKKQRGFTLIEVVVAIVMIGIGFWPLFILFENALVGTQDTEEQLIANQLAEETVEWIKATPYSEWALFDDDNTDGHTQVTFSAGNVMPVSVPTGWEVLVALDQQSTTGSIAYPINNEHVTIQQMFVTQGVQQYAALNINGQVYVLKEGTIFPNIRLDLTKTSTHYTLSVIDERAAGPADDVVLYMQQTQANPPTCSFYFSNDQEVDVTVEDTTKLLELKCIEEHVTASPTLTVNGAQANVTKHQLYTQTLKKFISAGSVVPEVKLEVTDTHITLTQPGELPEVVGVMTGHEPLVQLKPHAEQMGKVVVEVTNKRIDPLVIEMTGDIEYQIETGLINKQFYQVRPQTSSHMLYALEVKVVDADAKERVKIITTKVE